MSHATDYLADIDEKVKRLPFGRISFEIVRHGSRTAEIIMRKAAKLHPKDNKSAISELETFILSLIEGNLSGKVDFSLDFNGGTIKTITIKNKEVINYGKDSSRQ